MGIDFDIVGDDYYDLVGRLFSGSLDDRIMAGELLLAYLRVKREEAARAGEQ